MTPSIVNRSYSVAPFGSRLGTFMRAGLVSTFLLAGCANEPPAVKKDEIMITDIERQAIWRSVKLAQGYFNAANKNPDKSFFPEIKDSDNRQALQVDCYIVTKGWFSDSKELVISYSTGKRDGTINVDFADSAQKDTTRSVTNILTAKELKFIYKKHFGQKGP